MNYEVDTNRYGLHNTGIYVRAMLNGRWGSYDMGDLSTSSLFDWLRSRNGNNPWAESMVAILLGHDQQAWDTVVKVRAQGEPHG